MKKYEYVRIRVGKFTGAACEEHRTVIDDYARRGRRYVGYIPIKMDGYGKFYEIDPIFGTDAEEQPPRKI